jgi:Fe-S-cluster-containing hydrogenase component 2
MAEDGGKRIFRSMPRLCTGCRICELVCSLSKTGRLNIYQARLKVVPGKALGSSYPVICRHCSPAPCYQACPVPEAMAVDTATGAVVLDPEHCIRCLACVEACPFGAIPVGPEGEMLKCDLCGGDPLCVRYCPPRPESSLPQLPLREQSCLQYAPFYSVNDERASGRVKE